MMLCTLQRGDSPLIVDVPHAGITLPPDIGSKLTAHAHSLPDTDWHVDRLYASAVAAGTTLMVATHSRYVVDLNRDPSGAALYPGADNTELCPVRSFGNEPIYRGDAIPDAAEVERRRALYFDPYQALLAAEIDRVHRLHGFAVLLDGHSIISEAPRFFAGRLPDLNLGTVRGASCAPDLARVASEVLAASAGFSHVVNGRFTGGYVTRHYGRPDQGIHALQLEMAQACYMDEVPPYRYDAARAAPLVAVLRRLTAALAAWRCG